MPTAPLRVFLQGDPTPAGKYVYQIEVAGVADWTPIYVGVGTGSRVWMHFAVAHGTRRGSGSNRRMIEVLRKALSDSGKTRVLILAEGLSKHAADELEILTIASLGRRLVGTGPLLNALAGGASPDPESCRAIRAGIPPELRVAAAELAAERRRWRAAAAKAALSKTAEQRSNAARKAAVTRKLRLAQAASRGGKEASAGESLSAAQKAAQTRRRRLAALRAVETKRMRAAAAGGQAPLP